MTIVKQFNNPHTLFQTPDDEDTPPEAAIAASVDNGDVIVLEQGSDTILVNRASVPELCALLRKLVKEWAT